MPFLNGQRVRRRTRENNNQPFPHGTIINVTERGVDLWYTVKWDGPEQWDGEFHEADLQPVEVEGISMPICPECGAMSFKIKGSTPPDAIPLLECSECRTTYSFDSVTNTTSVVGRDAQQVSV